MDVFPSFGRHIAVVFVATGAIACTSAASAGAAAPQTLATAASVQVKAEAASADQRSNRLRILARRACAAHRPALCRQGRHLLFRAEAQAARLHREVKRFADQPRSVGASEPPAGSATPNGSGSTGSTLPSSRLSQAAPAPSSINPALPSVYPPPLAPVATATPGSTAFQPGIDSGMEASDLAGAAFLGAKLVRIEWPIDTPATQLETVIAGYAAKGIRVLPLASFYGRLPTKAEAQNLLTWAKAYGPDGTFWVDRSDGQLAIQSIEFGNETSYGYQYGDGAGDASYQERLSGCHWAAIPGFAQAGHPRRPAIPPSETPAAEDREPGWRARVGVNNGLRPLRAKLHRRASGVRLQ